MTKYIPAIALGLGLFDVSSPVQTFPASLLLSAQRAPLEFAIALAAAAVPSGIEIKETDDMQPPEPPSRSTGNEETVAAVDVVKAFNANHRDYQATLMDAVLIVRPLADKAPFLDTPSKIQGPLRVTGLMAAARNVFSPLNPRLLGVILNSMGREGDDTVVVLDGTGRTVIGTLNQIVAQGPPRTWLVTTRSRPEGTEIVSFGFILRSGGRRFQQLS